MKAAELFDRLYECYEKVGMDVRVSVTRFMEGAWRDFLRGLEAALGDTFEPGLEGGSLQGTLALLDKLVTQYSGRLEALVEESRRRLSEELLRELESKVGLALETPEQVLRLLRGEPEEAFALAAYAARERLPRRPPAVKPWESPGEWARALELSYDFEVGMNTLADLLCEISEQLRELSMSELDIADAPRRPE